MKTISLQLLCPGHYWDSDNFLYWPKFDLNLLTLRDWNVDSITPQTSCGGLPPSASCSALLMLLLERKEIISSFVSVQLCSKHWFQVSHPNKNKGWLGPRFFLLVFSTIHFPTNQPLPLCCSKNMFQLWLKVSLFLLFNYVSAKL